MTRKNKCPGCTDPLMRAVESAASFGVVDKLIESMADVAATTGGSVKVDAGPDFVTSMAVKGANHAIHLLVAIELERPGTVSALGWKIREHYALEKGKSLSIVRAEDAEIVAELERYAAHLADPDARREEAATDAGTQDTDAAHVSRE